MAAQDPKTTSREAAAEAALSRAARAVLSHPLALEQEDESAQMLRAMGLAAPTGADALLLGQYLKALRGDTAAAKFVRDAAADETPEAADVSEAALAQLSDADLYALAREAGP